MGKPLSTPSFIVTCRDGQMMLDRAGVLELMEKNAVAVATSDLDSSKKLRDAADAFRDWADYAEPGWVSAAHEVGISIFRLSSVAPLVSLLAPKPKLKIAT